MPHPQLTDADIYARSLVSRGHGYPLWLPEPIGLIGEYRSVGVRIGDVGSVTPEGAFETIFNVRAAADDPINRFGVPEGFQPILIDDCHATTLTNLHGPGAIPCRSGTQVGLSVGVSATDNLVLPASAGAGLEILWSSNEGAVVHLPSGASRVRVPPEFFREYIIKNAKSWYDFVNGPNLCRGIPSGSLYLVTACDKAHSWMVGAFSEASSSRAVSLKVGALGLGQAEATFSYAWSNTRAPTYRIGPHVYNPPMIPGDRSLQGGGDQSNGPPPNDLSAPDGRNQCIFIRGFSIALKKSFFKQREETEVSLIEAFKPSDIIRLSKQYNPSQYPSRGQTGSIDSSTSKRTQQKPRDAAAEIDISSLSPSDSDGVEVEIEFVPGTALVGAFEFWVDELSLIPRKPFHPAPLLTQYLFEAVPEAEIAITHDDDWCTLIDADADIPPTVDFRKYIQCTAGGAHFSGLEYLVEKTSRLHGSELSKVLPRIPAGHSAFRLDEIKNKQPREVEPDSPISGFCPLPWLGFEEASINTDSTDFSTISSETLEPLLTESKNTHLTDSEHPSHSPTGAGPSFAEQLQVEQLPSPATKQAYLLHYNSHSTRKHRRQHESSRYHTKGHSLPAHEAAYGVCPQCSRIYARHDALLRHLKSVHNDNTCAAARIESPATNQASSGATSAANLDVLMHE